MARASVRPDAIGYWLKAVGHARGPLAENWLEQRAEHFDLAVEALASVAAR